MESRASDHKRRRSEDHSPVIKRKKHGEPGLRSPNGLAHLPEEVLLLILDTILGALIRCQILADVLQHVAALHSLCLTNKTFNRLATPYLCTFVSNRNRRKLPQTLDAMILDSKKAASVKYMSWALDVKRSTQAMCRRSPKAESMFLQKLGRLGIPELAGDLRQCFHGNSPEYHLATALVLAPNLEYLEAADVNYEQETLDDVVWRPTWLELLALKALSNPPGLAQHFQKLHHLYLGMGELKFEQIGPLLRLPGLRTLHLVGDQHNGGIPAQPWNEELSQRCSAIETLIFEHCSVSSKIVAQVLDVIKHLTVFKLETSHWSSSGDDEDGPGEQQFSWPILSRAISEHKESLERLYLIHESTDSLEVDRDEGVSNPLEHEHLECLRDLPNLRYLDTGLTSFPGNVWTSFYHTFLPKLEHLVIKVEENRRYTMDAYQSSLQDLAQNCRSRLPLLQDIVVWLPKKSHTLNLNFSACKTAFESQGVGMTFLYCDFDAESDLNVNYNPHVKSPTWRLPPSTVDEVSLSGSESWGCRLIKTVRNLNSTDGRVPVVLHGPSNTYHHPYGWSIIDDLARGRP